MRKRIVIFAVLVLMLVGLSTAPALANPPPPKECYGTGTPGYWKNHPEAWPVEVITLGGITYTKEEAIEFMGMPEKGDKTYTMFRALVAAKLNVLNGCACPPTNIMNEYIEAADAWMAEHEVGSGVKGRDAEWQKPGEYLYRELDQYNNGEWCWYPRD